MWGLIKPRIRMYLAVFCVYFVLRWSSPSSFPIVYCFLYVQYIVLPISHAYITACMALEERGLSFLSSSENLSFLFPPFLLYLDSNRRSP